MESLKSGLKRSAPELFNTLRSLRDALVRAGDYSSMALHPWWKGSKRKLKDYQDRYQGERCFIIGNGPSLNKTDLTHLKDEYTFGMNRIYLAFPDMGYQTSFLVSINDLVVEQCHQDFQGLNLPKFFSWHSKDLLLPAGNPDSQTHFLHTTYTGPRFNDRITSRFWEGATVTNVCLQLAFCMGFTEVYLIGVDHNFNTKGEANKTVISDGDDLNHFNPEYFGRGFRWQLPDLETSELAYTIAKESFQAAGRKVFDATLDGKLQIFQKIDYDSLF